MINYSIQNKRGIYSVQFRIPDKKGKLCQKTKSTGIKAIKGNKRKAEERAREIIKEYEGLTAERDKMLFTDYIADWIERDSPKISITTYDHYKAGFKKHIEPYFAKLKLHIKDVKSMHIETFCNDKIAEGLSPNTVIKHFAIIRTSLQDAVKNGYLQKNPAEFADKPKRVKPKHDFYSPDELQKAFNIVRNTALELPVFFAIWFGLRRSEALGLRWCDIDFEKKIISIHCTAVLSNGKIVFRNATKTEASQADIPMNDAICEYLKAIKYQQEQMPRTTNAYIDYVCVDAVGEIVKPDYVTHRFPELMAQNGLKHICYHELRHSCISMVASEFNIKVAQAVARHANYNLTADTYSHIDKQGVAIAIDSVTNKLGADLLTG